MTRNHLAAAIAAATLLTASGQALAVTKNFQLSCPFPLIGAMPIDVKLQADIPSSVAVGADTGVFNLSVDATIDQHTLGGLRVIQAGVVGGTAMSAVTLTLPEGGELPLQIPIAMEDTDVPCYAPERGEDTLTIPAYGQTPNLVFSTGGQAVVRVDDIRLEMFSAMSNGAASPAPFNDFEADCEIVGGPFTLTTINVGGMFSAASATAATDTSSSATEPASSSASWWDNLWGTDGDSSSTDGSATSGSVATNSAGQCEPLRGEPVIRLSGTGESYVKSADGSIPLSATIEAVPDLMTGAVEATLDLAPSVGDFKPLYGLLPTIAEVEFRPAGAVTGSFDNSELSTSAPLTVYLPNISANLFGLKIPLAGGDECRSKESIAPVLGTPAGEKFSLATGGRVTGEYELSGITECGFLTSIVGLFMGGSGNTIDLALQVNR